ncbi:hypothetical protein GCM10011326_45720 [Salipiger profundus]|nr:hypothetical protein GCM10011326_45720 [Salipiger profundus]
MAAARIAGAAPSGVTGSITGDEMFMSEILGELEGQARTALSLDHPDSPRPGTSLTLETTT